MMYTSHWTVAQIGEQLEIFVALRDGRLAATGRRPTPDALREGIPQLEWHDLTPDVSAPYRRLENGTKGVPWLDILVLRADVERQWRRQSEIDGRSKYQKSWFRDRYLSLRAAKPSFSQNELIEELQDVFQTETNREPPSRPSIQRYIKGL